jgi:hypothetical protein
MAGSLQKGVDVPRPPDGFSAPPGGWILTASHLGSTPISPSESGELAHA